jgi:homeobox protein cut-like
MNTLLREEIRVAAERNADEKREYQAKIDALERETASLNNTLSSLESQLSAAPSHSMVEKMRRELRILKRLEYNAGEEEHETERDPEIAGTDDENDLETVLMAKLRRSEKELIAERNSKTELAETNASLTKAMEELERAKAASESLVVSLEKDLERAIATPTASSQGLKRTTSAASAHRLLSSSDNPEMLEHILDPSLPPPTATAAPRQPPQLATTEKAEDDHSVATIVMAQRDRLRARCEALEAERDSFKRELQGQVQASESLKADNTKLYEKVRYLQNYANTKGTGGSGKAYMRTSGGVGLDRDLDLEALEQRYEASVDPFKQFSKSERQRKLGEMSPMERTVFVVAKTVLCK